MEINLEKINIDNETEAGTETETWSGIDIGVTSKNFAVKTVSQLIKKNGWKVKGMGIEEWSFSGLKEIDNRIYAFCPYMEGVLLHEVLELPILESLKYIQKLLDAMELLEQRSIPLFNIFTDSVFFDKSDNVIFLPNELISKIRIYKPEKYRIDTYKVINNPDLSLKYNISFNIASLLYKIITGRFPFYSNDEEEMDSMIRMLQIIPPDEIITALSSEMSFFIKESLNSKAYTALSISAWKEKIEKWLNKDQDKMKNIQDQKDNLDSVDLNQLLKQKNEIYNKKIFWLRNWKGIAIKASAAIAIVLVVFFFVSNLLKPRITKGFTPEQVVKSFYLAANDLDHILMDDCVINDSGKELRNEAMHLTIVSKMQTVKYANSSYIVAADDWAENGRPEIPSTSVLYGIAEFKILEANQISDEEWQYTVQYEKWNPNYDNIESGTAASLGQNITEKVYLTLDSEDWVIYKIERLVYLIIE